MIQSPRGESQKKTDHPGKTKKHQKEPTMIYASIVVLAIGLYAMTITLTNIITMHNQRMRRQDKTPKVSVCIPARNEEANIVNCVHSFQKQDYPDYEILVLDDNSEDSTASLVQALAEKDDRIRLIKGKPLPSGWRGKVYAMKQLVDSAKGEYILFTDADTIHKPISIRSGIDLLLTNNAKMVSGYPLEISDSAWALSCVAIMVMNTMIYLPIAIQNKMQLSPLAMAIGQYIMVEKKSLLEAGGLEAIKDVMGDDVNLARLFCNSGHKQIFANMKYALSCRMYNTLGEAIKGMERGFFGAIKLNPVMKALLPFGVVFLTLLALLPLISLVLLIATSFSIPSIILAAGTALIYTAYGIITHYHSYKFPVPLMGSETFFFCGLLLAKGMFHHISNRPIEWKGRKVTYDK